MNAARADAGMHFAARAARMRRAGDFADTPRGRVALADLLAPPDPTLIAAFRGQDLLLACETQIETMAALLALDGIAARLRIWPHGGAHAATATLAAMMAPGCAVTSWPPSTLPDQKQPAPGAVTQWVLFTSGTTGLPKMVVHTLETLSAHIAPAAPAEGAWASFYDVRRYGGMQVQLRVLLGGGSIVLSERGEAIDAFLARCAAAGATRLLGTPSEWRRALLAGAGTKLAPNYVRLSGEVADQAILDRLGDTFPAARLVHAFASTEAGLAFEVEDRRAGFPAAWESGLSGLTEIDTAGATLRVRSPLNALGVLRDGAIAPLRGPDGFVDTGDALQRDGDRFVFAGRQDGVVNVGGEKVHPEEVEAVINAHPEVAMSLVSARPSATLGALVRATIVPREADADRPALIQAVRAHCRAHLAAHKVPVSIEIAAALPVTEAGKLARHG